MPINKNSLLDATIALSGSEVTHISMLVVVLTMVQYPDMDAENALFEICERIFITSVLTHALATIWIIGMRSRRFRASNFAQVIQILQVLSNLYLICTTFEAYTIFQLESIGKGDLLTDLDLHPIEDNDLHVLSVYHYWALFELLVFFTYIISIFLHLLCHQLSPFKVYQYYLTMATTR